MYRITIKLRYGPGATRLAGHLSIVKFTESCYSPTMTHRKVSKPPEDEICERVSLQAVKIRTEILSDEHPDTLATMDNLAITYLDQGRTGEAPALQEQVLEKSRRILGDEHPDDHEPARVDVPGSGQDGGGCRAREAGAGDTADHGKTKMRIVNHGSCSYFIFITDIIISHITSSNQLCPDHHP